MRSMNRGKFEDFVRRWRLGPGMNDLRRESQAGVRRQAERALSRYHTEEQREGEKRVLTLMEEGLYSGFDGTVGDGWIPILDRLCEDLVRMGWGLGLDQVKEKFGTLRFYIRGGTQEMQDRIEQAEWESARTCENCGARGSVRGQDVRRYWIKTLCDSCQDICTD